MRPALLVGLCSGSAALASCGWGAAVGRIAPAFCLGAASCGLALGAAAVCVGFGAGVALRLGVCPGSGSGSDFNPTMRCMRSSMPLLLDELDEFGELDELDELEDDSLPFEENRPPNQLPLEELVWLVGCAAATRVVRTGLSASVPVGSPSRGGEACDGIVPGSETPGERMMPDASV